VPFIGLAFDVFVVVGLLDLCWLILAAGSGRWGQVQFALGVLLILVWLGYMGWDGLQHMPNDAG
jgi:hypothetical protein